MTKHCHWDASQTSAPMDTNFNIPGTDKPHLYKSALPQRSNNSLYKFHAQTSSGLFFARCTETWKQETDDAMFIFIPLAWHLITARIPSDISNRSHTIAYGKQTTEITRPDIWGILVCEPRGKRSQRGHCVSPAHIPSLKKEATLRYGLVFIPTAYASDEKHTISCDISALRKRLHSLNAL